MGASGRKRGDSQAGRRRARRRGSRSSSRRSPFVTGGCHCRTRSGGGGGPGAARAALQHGSAGSGTARPGWARLGRVGLSPGSDGCRDAPPSCDTGDIRGTTLPIISRAVGQICAL